MKGKLIDNFKKWSIEGELPDIGLCCTLEDTEYEKTLNLFQPTEKDRKKLVSKLAFMFWGYDKQDVMFTTLRIRSRKLTPLRQTILAFICVMHDEV